MTGAMHPWSARDRRRLQQELRATRDARLYRRVLALVQVSGGQRVEAVAQALGVGRRSVYRWLDRYGQSGGPEALADAPRSGRPSKWTPRLRWLLTGAFESAPPELGYWRSQWTVPLLQAHLRRLGHTRLSPATVRRELARRGGVWKRGRYRLPPPVALEKKTPDPMARAPLARRVRSLGRR